MLESRGFEGGMALGFTGEGERTAGREEDDDPPDARAPRGRTRGQRTRGARVHGRLGSAWLGRGLGRAAGPGGEEGEAAWEKEGGGGSGLGGEEGPKRRRERRRGRRGRLRPRAEGREGGLWARLGPKGGEGDYLGFSF
uniref:BKRF1 encodes EBNA-1 protein-like n=1 Tax=Oryza sativa subsp. japonica TaxID=39947 RepID=Q5Z8S8_ORYSJ|nr:BKRF1 encodes EBNA-1 protein -like [Oryza sativa Japonica Group]